MTLNIAIVGAGIIGITSACRILELIPNAKITIIAEKYSPNTTSDVSAGYWEPYCLDDDQANLILKWGKETYDRMMKVANSENANKYGIQSLVAFVVQDEKNQKIPYWTKIVSNFKVMTIDDVNNVIYENPENRFKGGFQFLTTTCVVNRYIPALINELRKKGVTFNQKSLNSLSQLISEEGHKYDYIVNCTGLGAQSFVPDKNVYPTKGQVIRVRAPWIKHCLMFETNEIVYFLPLSDLVVVGGTQEENVYDLKTDSCDEILNRAQKYLPSLKDAEIVGKGAGLRPSRKGGIRLELEFMQTTKVIHNYGHGGSGITLSWGCATNVVDILKQDMARTSIRQQLNQSKL